MTITPGDIFIAASDVDDSNIDLRNHKGEGRILHLSHDFKAKGEIRTGVDGLLVGLARSRDTGLLYAADPTARAVFKINPETQTSERLSALDGGGYGSVAMHEDQIFLGVHSHRGKAPDDPEGPKKLVQISPDGEVLAAYGVKSDGGHTGWHGVTSIAFSQDGKTAYTLSEGGHAVFVHDLTNDAPQERFFTSDEKLFGLARLGNGRLFIAIGHGVLVLSADGKVIGQWHCEGEKGWTRITPAPGGKTVYVSNFLEGFLERRDAPTGAVLARHDIARKCSLCGLVEIP